MNSLSLFKIHIHNLFSQLRLF